MLPIAIALVRTIVYHFLFITGVPAMVPYVTANQTAINVNEKNVTLTLNWGEPFNNLDLILSYTLSCSGDVTCPPNFTTSDATTREYTIKGLTPMTKFTFSVVATNSIGNGEAGVQSYITAGEIIIYYTTTISACACIDAR